ncbi:phospholipase A2 [Varanus komodoensis]|nr:phospholipase A2 [Varanus komodoensis]
MIKCVIPSSNPVWDFSTYGCYCGLGGSGTPVDALDRCCQAHDNCYSAAKKHPECRFLLDNPYMNTYHYKCSGTTITCEGKNGECEAFICNCDRSAALCFAGAPHHGENKRPGASGRCQ